MSAHGKSEPSALSGPEPELQDLSAGCMLEKHSRCRRCRCCCGTVEAGHAAIKLADWRGSHAFPWLGTNLEEAVKAIRYTVQLETFVGGEVTCEARPEPRRCAMHFLCRVAALLVSERDD